MSLGGLWVWLAWKGTCQIKSVDGDAIKYGRGKLGIFTFFPKTWHILLLSLCFLVVWTPLRPNCWCLECTLGVQIAVSYFHHIPPLLGTKEFFCTSVCTLGIKALMGIVPCIDHIALTFPLQYPEPYINTARCFLVPVAAIKANCYRYYITCFTCIISLNSPNNLEGWGIFTDEETRALQN